MAELGATDWRAEFDAAWPDAPAWALEPVPDLTAQLSRITCPVLLVWATRDPISPLAAGERLLAALPNARLVSYDSDDHWVAAVHAEDVATEIADLPQRRPHRQTLKPGGRPGWRCRRTGRPSRWPSSRRRPA